MEPTARQPASRAQKTYQPRVEPRARPKPRPPHAVILHKDRINGFDHVVAALQKVFHYGAGKALWLTCRARITGRCVVWSGHLELAELKAEQLRGFGPDPKMSHRGALPLKVSTEPLPG